MKKQQFLALTLIILIFNACTENYTSTDYLKKVSSNLETIESATYNLTAELWYLGDTVASASYHLFIKEYTNPADTTIGSSYVQLDQDDSLRFMSCYDGQMRAVANDDEKRIVLDDFTARPLPFRPLTPPFFNYVKSIIKYALETKDSISLDIKDLKDSVYLKLTINEENQIEFFGKPFRMPQEPYTFGENTSIYELWIDKKTDLPYKVRREMFHNISVDVCKGLELNKLNIEDFKASDYFPADYTIELYGEGEVRKTESEYLGKKAPDWTLQTADDKPLSLGDLKSKVLMIQFTSVSCGPCRASVPFLKELSSSYKKEDFDFVAIECTSRNTNVLKKYMSRNDFEYKFLLSTKDVRNSYSITSYPVFFILDENRVIKNVLNGYGQGTTDEKIKAIINGLI